MRTWRTWCGRRGVAEEVWQKRCGRTGVAGQVWQKRHGATCRQGTTRSIRLLPSRQARQINRPSQPEGKAAAFAEVNRSLAESSIPG